MASAVEAGGGPTSYGSTGGAPRTSFAALPKASVAYHTPLVASEASSSGGLALRRGTQVRARTLGLTVPRGAVAVRAALTMKSGPHKTTAAAIHVATPGRIAEDPASQQGAWGGKQGNSSLVWRSILQRPEKNQRRCA